MNIKGVLAFIGSFVFVIGLTLLILFTSGVISTEQPTTVCAEHNFSIWVEDNPATCEELGRYHRTCTVCSYVEHRTMPKLNHEADSWVVTTPATCTQTGVESAVCSMCNKTVTRQISALGHDFETNFTVDQPSTCTTQGSRSRHCSRCDAKTQVEAIPLAEHDYGELTLVHEATCTLPETWQRECSACHNIEEQEVNPPLGHLVDSSVFVTDFEETCTTDGQKSNHCTRDGCDYIENIQIIPASHLFEETFTTDLEPTCTTQGSMSRHCSRCTATTDVTPINELGHDYGDYVETKPATCTEDGEETRTCRRSGCGHEETQPVTALGHDFEDEFTIDVPATCIDNGSKSRHCTRCSETTEQTVIAATGEHSYGEWQDVPPATCTQSGEQEAFCEYCLTRKTQQISPLGHEFSVEVELVSATCTDSGSGTYKCIRCDETEGSYTINALGHDYGTWETSINPTCTQTGEEKQTCSRCHDEQTRLINALGHDYGAFTQTKPATCTQAGEQTRTCQRSGCGHVDTQAINALGHNYSSTFTTDLEPTCTTEGSRSRHCTRCDAKTEVTQIDALGHEFMVEIEDEDTKPATCEETGIGKLKCSRCDETQEYSTPALGHLYDTSQEPLESPATCTENGFRYYVCQRCRANDIVEEIPAHGHEGPWEIIDATCTESGEMVQICVNCGFETRQTTSGPLGHDYIRTPGRFGDLEDPNVCYDTYDYVTCSRCDYATIENQVGHPHTWDSSTGTCSICWRACEHDWIINEYATVVCGICGYVNPNQDLDQFKEKALDSEKTNQTYYYIDNKKYQNL